MARASAENSLRAPLVDRCGRAVTSLRVSVTDRCNLRCTYCMPADAADFVPRKEVLSYEDLHFVTSVVNSIGITKIRLTGGEPLLRKDLHTLIEMLVSDSATTDVSLTTNALLLDKYAQRLRAAGLKRLNISLDSTRADRFEKLARADRLSETWRGIDAATAAGFVPLKINAVVLRGVNDDEVEEWLERTRTQNIIVRFLELMPIGEGAEQMSAGAFVNLTEMRTWLEMKYGLERVAGPSGNGPARYWQIPGAPGRIGFITPLSEKYCDTCSRFRISATGKVRPCLAFDTEVDARPAIVARDAEAVIEVFRRAAAVKPTGHQWELGQVTRTGMSTIGG